MLLEHLQPARERSRELWLEAHRTGKEIGEVEINKSLALAMLAPEHAEVGTEVQISILGKAHRAVVIPECPFDPENTVLKGA